MKNVLLCLAVLAAAAQPVVVNDDGGWCWFQDERAVLHGGKLYVGSVASGFRHPARKGDVEVTAVDLNTFRSERATLHHGLNWLDDHNAPALLERPDGRLLAAYSRHGDEARMYFRVLEGSRWSEEQVYVPSPSSRVTYNNLFWLSAERRVYDFFRGLDNSFKPSYIWSDDLGAQWRTGAVFIHVPSTERHRPYVKYASNGRDTIHIVYTEGHPRDFDNSVYHVYYRAGTLHQSDGTPIRALKEGLRAPNEGTRIFQGDPANVAWVSDLHLDPRGRPVLLFSVQKDSAGLPDGQGGEDLRYRYARWEGGRWRHFEIAHAGSKLYPGEDDYTGNAALDPQDVNTAYISTNADPVTGQPLPGRHWQIYRGRTADAGQTWKWTPLTHDADRDNIRPLVPILPGRRSPLLWLRGRMRAYTDYSFEIVALP